MSKPRGVCGIIIGDEKNGGIQMRSLKKAISAILIFTTLLAFTGCSTSFSKIEKDDMVKACEQYLGWKADENYQVYQDYKLELKKTDDSKEELNYDLDWYVVGLGLTDDAPKAYLTYYVFASDKDAKEYWGLKINQGNNYQACLSYISADSKDHFKGFYCVSNMYFVIEGMEEDGVKAVKDLLTSFNYPVEKK